MKVKIISIHREIMSLTEDFGTRRAGLRSVFFSDFTKKGEGSPCLGVNSAWEECIGCIHLMPQLQAQSTL